MEEGIVSIRLPVVAEGEPSPFDFFLDPDALLYDTDAMLYGGGTVEKGATMLFRNKEGKYDFSRYSDKLSIINENENPVIVTVSASVSGLEGVLLLNRMIFLKMQAHVWMTKKSPCLKV